MNLEFQSGFERDLAQTRDKKLARIILDCIHLFEDAKQLNDISNLKKMVGHPTAWRYRKGKYRVGFYFENNTITFAAFAPRDQIYRKFP